MKRSTFIQEKVIEELKGHASDIATTPPKDSGEIIAVQLMTMNQILGVIADRLADIADEMEKNNEQ